MTGAAEEVAWLDAETSCAEIVGISGAVSCRRRQLRAAARVRREWLLVQGKVDAMRYLQASHEQTSLPICSRRRHRWARIKG